MSNERGKGREGKGRRDPHWNFWLRH